MFESCGARMSENEQSQQKERYTVNTNINVYSCLLEEKEATAVSGKARQNWNQNKLN